MTTEKVKSASIPKPENCVKSWFVPQAWPTSG